MQITDEITGHNFMKSTNSPVKSHLTPLNLFLSTPGLLGFLLRLLMACRVDALSDGGWFGEGGMMGGAEARQPVPMTCRSVGVVQHGSERGIRKKVEWTGPQNLYSTPLHLIHPSSS